MSATDFYKYFGLVSLGTAALLFGLSQIAILQPYLLFSFISLALFMLLTLVMFLFGEKTAKSSNKNLFTTLVLGFTFLKIFLSLFVVIAYYKVGNPSSKVFLIPFFIVYLIFTIFETYLMMKISKNTKPVEHT